jgi:hypothetical protein
MSGPKSLFPPFAVVAIVFVICLIVAQVQSPTNDLQSGAVRAFYVIGGLISVISAVVLLLQASREEPLPSLIPWIVALLAGVLVISFNWGAAVGLAGIAVAIVIREMRGRGPTV